MVGIDVFFKWFICNKFALNEVISVELMLFATRWFGIRYYAIKT